MPREEKAEVKQQPLINVTLTRNSDVNIRQDSHVAVVS